MEKKSQCSFISNKNDDPKNNIYWDSCAPVGKHTGSGWDGVNLLHSSFYGRSGTKICDHGRFVTSLILLNSAWMASGLSLCPTPAPLGNGWRHTRGWWGKPLSLADQRDVPQQMTLWPGIKLREKKRKGFHICVPHQLLGVLRVCFIRTCPRMESNELTPSFGLLAYAGFLHLLNCPYLDA